MPSAYSPVTLGHVPAVLSVPVEQRVRADAKLALDEHDLVPLALRLIVYGLAGGRMLWKHVSL
jgi:hypothetical protein